MRTHANKPLHTLTQSKTSCWIMSDVCIIFRCVNPFRPAPEWRHTKHRKMCMTLPTRKHPRLMSGHRYKFWPGAGEAMAFYSVCWMADGRFMFGTNISIQSHYVQRLQRSHVASKYTAWQSQFHILTKHCPIQIRQSMPNDAILPKDSLQCTRIMY